MSRLVSLYPGPWRRRYETEFLAVLESRPLTIGDRVDIVRGAIDARLHPSVRGPERVPDRFGYLPLVGFALFWAALAIAATGPVHVDAYGSYRDGAAAIPVLLVSTVLLSTGLFRILTRLPSDARAAALAGTLAIFFGPLWGLVPWLLPFGLLFMVGLFGLAIGARSAGIMSTGSVVVLGLVLLTPLILVLASMVLPWYALRTSDVNALVLIVPLSLIWLVIGWTLLRGFRPLSGPPVEPTSRT
jgi:hypothetical protein